MKTITLTVNDQTEEGSNLLAFLRSLNFVAVHDSETKLGSGAQAAKDCNAVPLDAFISELHNKVEKHFVNK